MCSNCVCLFEALWVALADFNGLSKSAAVEMIIRQAARAEGLERLGETKTTRRNRT